MSCIVFLLFCLLLQKFLKGDNLLQVIRSLFSVMASPMEDEDAEDEDEETDLLLGYTAQAVASQVCER